MRDIEIKTESKYLEFEVRPPPPGRKMLSVVVISKSGGYALGEVRWHGAWRQFCFHTLPGRYIFNKGCMTEICSVMDELMLARRSQ